MANINDLRKLRNADFSKITEQLAKQEKTSYEDTRFWKLDTDKAGNGSALIRFLPASDAGEYPWVKLFKHAFKGPSGKWFFENSLTTLGLTDPLSDMCHKLYNSELESDKALYQQRKRKLSYISNILVINDPNRPENNGKVFLFAYGQSIFSKIKDKIKPEDDMDQPVNVFDYWEGCNFKLRAKKVGGWQNYDTSSFDNPVPIGDDALIEKIANEQHKLSELVSADKFKTVEEIQAKLDDVLGAPTKPKVENNKVEYIGIEDEPKPKVNLSTNLVDEDSEDIHAYFKKIAD